MNSPAAQPMKPSTWSQMRPTTSARTTAKMMPMISSVVIIAAPLAARMSFRIRSLTLRT